MKCILLSIFRPKYLLNIQKNHSFFKNDIFRLTLQMGMKIHQKFYENLTYDFLRNKTKSDVFQRNSDDDRCLQNVWKHDCVIPVSESRQRQG